MMKGDETPYEFFRGPLPGLYKPLNRFDFLSCVEYADQYDQLTSAERSGKPSGDSKRKLWKRKLWKAERARVGGLTIHRNQDHSQWIEFDTQVRDVHATLLTGAIHTAESRHAALGANELS